MHVVRRIVARHEALRFQLHPSEGPNSGGEVLTHVDVVVKSADYHDATDEELATQLDLFATGLHRSLNLYAAPLARFAILNLGAARGKWLLLIVHHLICDGASIRLLFREIRLLTIRLMEDGAYELRPTGVGAGSFAEALERAADESKFDSDVPRWAELAQSGQDIPLEMGTPASNTVSTAAAVRSSLTLRETAEFLGNIRAKRTSVRDYVPAAIVASVTRHFTMDDLRINIITHGRSGQLLAAPIAQTIGWLATRFPVVVREPDPCRTVEAFSAFRRAVPGSGESFGVLRYVRRDRRVRARMRALGEAELAVNYQGSFPHRAPGGYPLGTQYSGLGRRDQVHLVNFSVVGGMLEIEWWYSSEQYQRHTIDQLVKGAMTELRSSR